MKNLMPLSCFIAILLTATTAFAQPNEQDEDVTRAANEQARYRFRQGALSYESGRFAEAAAHFEAAYEFSPRDEMFYNIFLAHRDGANLRGALEALERYLESGASSQLAPQRERLERTLIAMRERLADASPEPDTEPVEPEADLVDSGSAEPTPDDATPISIGGNSQEETSQMPREVGNPTLEIAGWTAIGVGAGGLVLGVVMQVLQSGEANDLDEACQFGSDKQQCSSTLDQQSIADRHSTYGAVRWVGFGVAIAGLSVGLGLLLWPDGDEPSVAVSCDAVGCRGHFFASF